MSRWRAAPRSGRSEPCRDRAVSADSVPTTFTVFCRIGACLMLVPGFSSVNIPVQIRLFVAVVVGPEFARNGNLIIEQIPRAKTSIAGLRWSRPGTLPAPP